jgi:hypothetical protein
MEKNADRGSARILVDGVTRTTVNTFATTAQHRQVVFTDTMTAGKHTISVVNLATPGHPRIDLDAFIADFNY